MLAGRPAGSAGARLSILLSSHGSPDMAFFGNDAVNRVNIHYAIQSLAQGAGGTLVFAFLLHAGVSIPMTFVWLAGMLAGRFVLRPLILPIGKRWGLKPLVIAGVLLNAVQYPHLCRGARARLAAAAQRCARRRGQHPLLALLPRLFRVHRRRRASRPPGRHPRGGLRP